MARIDMIVPNSFDNTKALDHKFVIKSGAQIVRIIIQGIAGLFILVLISACASQPVATELAADGQWHYLLNSEDEIKVVVYGEEELSDTYKVDAAGNISIPLIGTIAARGQTTTGLEKVLTTRLADGFLNNPNVRVEMVTYRPFFILGEVRTPGKYPYTPGLTVFSAVAIGGGFTYRANTDDFEVVRQLSNGEKSKGSAKRESPLYPGDIVYVRERLF